MIPVRVADQKMDAVRSGPAQHIHAQQPDSCTTIQDNRRPIRVPDFDA